MAVAGTLSRATITPAPGDAVSRYRRGGRPSDDRGSSSVEFVILFPIIVVLLLGGPQLAMWYFAREAAEAAGDDVAAAAMIDRLVHHAEVIATSGTQSCN
jgi:Flp pilus assembly protein TadG